MLHLHLDFRKLSKVSMLLFLFLIIFNKNITIINALTLAEEYASHIWTPSDKNINHSLYKDIGRSSIFKAGEKVTGVAYAWGGSDTTSNFDTRISNGEPAGLIYSTNSSGTELSWETYHKFGLPPIN